MHLFYGLKGTYDMAVGPATLVLRTIGAYLVILLGFRIFGKRELGQVTVFDVAMILLIANAVQNAMVGPDTSLLGGAIVSVTLLVLNFLVAKLRIHDRLLRHVVEGRPSVLISNGCWHDEVLRREGLDHGEVRAAMRQNGVLETAKVRLAVLEANGSISVVPSDAKTVHIPAQHRAKTRGLLQRGK